MGPRSEVPSTLIVEGVRKILDGLGEMGLDVGDPNFLGTPERVARAYNEIFGGITDTEQQVEEILRSVEFPSKDYDSIILAQDIVAYSMCPHHLLPVEYGINLAYLPGEKGQVLGLSKLVRVVELLSRRPVLQETLTQDIVDFLKKIEPRGIGVVVTGIHFCMRMRGVKNRASVTTSAMWGDFLEDPSVRKEFFDLMQMRRAG